MAKDDPHFRLRIPSELKALIEQAASVRKSSLNSEIVDRLSFSFKAERELKEMAVAVSELLTKNNVLEIDIEHRRKEAAKAAELQGAVSRLEQELSRKEAVITDQLKSLASWEEWATQRDLAENSLYVVLDADGHPQSWDEIVTHLQAISEASGGKIERIDAGVFDAPRESNDKRFAQWLKLREFYRSKRQSTEASTQ